MAGKVTFKGKPLAGGSVTVVGTDNVPRLGGIAADGTYAVGGVPAGEVRVSVSWPAPPAEAAPAAAALPPPEAKKRRGMALEGVPAAAADRKTWFRIPERYGDVATSGLRYAVAGGANAVDVKMD